ncbi:HdeD family acid-resistance protein [Tenacibaculum sp. UWU-22]|uniref:HdeD family acid-resistance protein n=1 Tax=Tenacibaculum sp. UWU-22 TaxID=3234187 RepID=UPI0034DB53E4
MKTKFKSIENRIEKTVKNWWIPLVIGILLLITSIWTFASPSESYLALTIVFSITFLVAGVMEIYFAIANRHEISGWGWNLTFGILTLIVGFMLIRNPVISTITLPLYVGFVLLFRSISSIGWAIDIKDYGFSSWKSVLFIGILGIILSIIILWDPFFGGLTVVFWTGLAFMTGSFFSFYIANTLRKLNKELKN